MYRSLLAILGLILVVEDPLHAKDLDTIIKESLLLKPSLSSIQERIASAESTVSLSGKFSNPLISFRKNDMWLSDPFNGSLEPMQFTAVDITQSIPFFGKRDADKKIALAQKNVWIQNLASARLALEQAIKIQAFKTWQLEKLFAIICEYESLTKQNVSLHESYTTTTSNHHMGIMSAELTLSNLRIKKSSLKSLLLESLAQLSYLSGQEIDSLEMDLKVNDMPGSKSFRKLLQNNLNVLEKEKEVEREEALLNRTKLDYFPDMSITLGYYQRDLFEDYASVGVGIKLPIYGAEGIKVERAKHMVMVKKSEKDDMKILALSQFQIAYAQMQNAFETYHIIVDSSLPQIEHMFDLTNASISTGGDLFKYIDILKQKLALEEQKIIAVAQYNIAHAKILHLIGQTQ